MQGMGWDKAEVKEECRPTPRVATRLRRRLNGAFWRNSSFANQVVEPKRRVAKAQYAKRGSSKIITTSQHRRAPEQM
jgi:hypothetical protein